MTIKEKARIAFERDLEVIVIEKGCISHEGHIVAYHTGSAGVEIHYPSDDVGETYEEKRIWYKDITEIRFVGEGVDPFGGQCHVVYGCNERQGAGRWCSNEACQHRMIWKNIAERTAATEKPEPSDEDIAKPQWMSVKHRRDDGDYELVISDGIMIKARQAQATPAEMDLMAAAPGLADALRMVVRESTFSRIQNGTHDSDTITVKFNPDGWRIIMEALNKAEIK